MHKTAGVTGLTSSTSGSMSKTTNYSTVTARVSRSVITDYCVSVVSILGAARVSTHPGPASGGAGPNWEQFQSAQVAGQLAPRSVLVCT